MSYGLTDRATTQNWRRGMVKKKKAVKKAVSTITAPKVDTDPLEKTEAKDSLEDYKAKDSF